MITIRDLDVFILTKNRPHFLSEAIQSLLAQTICPDRLTLLDNSDDNETF
jgi:glycosyltransferase involved in cell wall biosynthesis